jgi:hypothetical protein
MPTISFTSRLNPQAVEALRRQAAISGWSMAQLIEAFALGLQDTWYARFTANERYRYEQKIMSRVEALEIRRRQSMKADGGVGARAGQSKNDGHGEDGLPGDAANDTGSPVKSSAA